jgi:hypothetical protein
MSYNRWNYTGSNPINRTDPSGNCWYPNLQTGGISIDLSDLSLGICSWFVTALQQNGISISPNVTPDNWMDSIPPEQRELLASLGCVDTIDYWMVIWFYTNPEWHSYKSISAEIIDWDLKLLAGGSYVFSCDNNSSECTSSFGVGVGGSAGVFGFKLGVSAGLGLDIETTGAVYFGGTAKAGPCDLFLGFTKISIGCTIGFEEVEMGWIRTLPEWYRVLIQESTIGRNYEDFARDNLRFTNRDTRIYYRVEAKSESKLELVLRFLDPNMIVFD